MSILVLRHAKLNCIYIAHVVQNNCVWKFSGHKYVYAPKVFFLKKKDSLVKNITALKSVSIANIIL